MESKEIKTIKETTEEFFNKMTIAVSEIGVEQSSEKNELDEAKEVVDISVILEEPQILIGQGGQTLFEIQRILRTVLDKKLKKIFYVNLDINGYKKKKVEYLKEMAKDLADQVALNKEEKKFPPMSSYERRIIHAELSRRTDVTTESQGEGFDRYIVIKPK